MAEPYIGEIRILANTFAPEDWALCDGSLINISDNPTLYQLLGTVYGGDGQTTFALPDLRGRVPMHAGNGVSLGQSGGTEQVQLQAGQLPVHNHLLTADADLGGLASPSNCVPAQSGGPTLYGKIPGQPGTAMSGQAVGPAGSSAPHDNMMPFLTLNYCISLYGQYPTQN